MKLVAGLFLALLLMTACEKGAGEGGTSTIKGVVITQEWDGSFSEIRDQYPSQEEDVYIIYGDDDFYGDDVKTNYNGVYEFKYLRKGSYTIYVYTKDASVNYDVTNRKLLIKREVQITSNNQTVTVDTIYVKK
jgi:hypothetical protein